MLIMEEEKGIHITGILTVFAAVLMNLIGGINNNLASISQYIASYLHYNGHPEISIKDVFFLMPIASFSQNIFAGIGGYLERKHGIRISISIGISLMFTGFYLFYSTSNIYVYYLSAAIEGSGVGLCYLSPMRVAWKHFPNRKGLVSGIIMTGFGLSATIFNLISDLIINPENEHLQPNNFYTEEIANRFPEYISIVLIVMVCASIIIVSCLFPVKEQKEDGDIIRKKIEFLVESDQDSDIGMSLNDISNSIVSQNASQLLKPNDTPTTPNDREPFELALKSCRFMTICVMVFCYIFYPLMLVNVVRPFGNLSLDPAFMRVLMIFFPIANGVSGFFWGMMLDYVPFKTLYITLILLGIIVSSTIGFISEIPWLYFIYCMITANLIGGNFTLMPAFTTKIFGIKNSTELYGIVCFFCGLSNLTGPFIAKTFIRETEKEDYLFVFGIGTFLLIISLICTISLKEKKFNYKKIIKRRKKNTLKKYNEAAINSVNA